MADNFLENQRAEYEARKAKKELERKKRSNSFLALERKKRFRRSLEAYKKKLAEQQSINNNNK